MSQQFELIEIEGNKFLYASFREHRFLKAAEESGLRLYWLRHGDDDVIDGASIESTPVFVNLNGMLLGAADIPENSFLEDENDPQEGELAFSYIGESCSLDEFIARMKK